MKTEREMDLRFEELLIAGREIDYSRPADTSTGVLWIVVPYTKPELTKAALRHAGICTDLNVHISLVDVQVVPFPCPLNQPPINKEFSRNRLRDLFTQSGLLGKAEVLYARNWLEGFRSTLEPHSLVILASKKRWWRTREEKLADELQKAGHHVMLLYV
jgi:hypothetical protein